MRKHYPVIALLIVLAAIALGAAFVTTNANALPTFTTAVGGIGPCQSCHTMDATHAKPSHTALACASCHVVNVMTPPTPAACAACHGGTSAILNTTAHVATLCNTTPGCHGVPSPATIAGFTPTAGPVGTAVTITGTGFTGATAVGFNGLAAATYSVASDTQITATVPVGATTGKIAVTPLSGSVLVSATDFTVTIAPVTTSVSLKVAPTSIKLKKTVKATGAVTPADHLADITVVLKAEIKVGSAWKAAKTGAATVSATGAYSWTYKPAKKGSYRMTASIVATPDHMGSKSPTKLFKVN